MSNLTYLSDRRELLVSKVACQGQEDRGTGKLASPCMLCILACVLLNKVALFLLLISDYRGKFASVEDISCRIKPGCKDHPPWPKGFCSKCQPNAITLNRQEYRHVDNVVFENPHLVERFLNYWRTTGHQRIGFLFGNYEIHSDVPLGIRATVAAIYEPPQESTRDSIVLLPDDKDALVDQLAQQLGLHRVGWIFTDLVADDVTKGTVKHVRNIESHFLSAEECIMAGHFQNQHPNPCRFSPVGSFGSKFVTVCVTGDSSNQVHMEGYGVSNQCMALVRDNCLIPTNVPELGYVRESTDKQYVPDVYYKFYVDVTKRELFFNVKCVSISNSKFKICELSCKAEFDLVPDPLVNKYILWKHRGSNLGPLDLYPGTLTTRPERSKK
uniref:Nuclear protein localization protein 4 homolog n=1 Tax=Timema cristinae TaxID=61476 RepID=A0A7R9DDA7_TIMCR|nr:unnamed protein product [Timema cristinae]